MTKILFGCGGAALRLRGSKRGFSSSLLSTSVLSFLSPLCAAAPAPEVGRPFVRVYSPAESGAEDDIRCAAQDHQGIMLFGTRGAVLEFDGENWRRLPVPTPGTVHRLATSADGAVWLLADGEIGRFTPAPDGTRRYESLTAQVPEAWREKFNGGCGLAARGAHVWASVEGALLHWNGREFSPASTPDPLALRLFDLGPQGLIAHGAGTGTLRLGADAPAPVPDAPKTNAQLAWLSPAPAAGQWLLAGNGATLVLGATGEQHANAKPLTFFPLAHVVSGARLPDGGFVFLLARDGVAVIDAGLRLRYLAGVADGIPVERVHAVFPDRAGGIWVCAARGLVRIEHRVPVTLFDYTDGLKPAAPTMTALLPPRSAQDMFSDGTNNVAGDVIRHEGRLFARLGRSGRLAGYDAQVARFVPVPGSAGTGGAWPLAGGFLVHKSTGMVLSAAGHSVAVAESGESALEQVCFTRPDLILLDVMLPGIDGLETCRRLKANPATQDVPVLFMTALGEVMDKVKGFAAGAVDYIAKPLNAAEVLARVNAHLRLRELAQALEQRADELDREVQRRVAAERELGRTLDRAVLVATSADEVLFCSDRAARLLAKYFPGAAHDRVPAALREPGRTPRGLRVSSSSPARASDCVLLLLEEATPAATPAALVPLGLTPRETEILFWLANGKTNADIAAIVGTAPATVKKHVENLLPKLGVDTRLAAALKAMELLGPPA